MKNKKLNMLIKASVVSGKLRTGFFCLFTLLSTVLIFLSLEVISPMKVNIDDKINNHISKRELITYFSDKIADEVIQQKVTEIQSLEHVNDVYRMPSSLMVKENSGLLFDDYSLSFLHTGCTAKITSGRAFDENETDVAIVPENFKDFNKAEKKINKIEGRDLIGKTLDISDGAGNTHKLEVVGAYNASDPIFSGEEILVPKAQLLNYNEMYSSNRSGEKSMDSEDTAYIVVVDNANNTEDVKLAMNSINIAYESTVSIDSDTYNMAMIIIFAALIFFLLLVVGGFLLTLKSNISIRTNEFALYRSVGYKSNHIFYIVFLEHFILVALSLVLGFCITVLLNHFVVNPYLYNLLGNTIMEITVKVSPVSILFIVSFYIGVLYFVCKSAVRKSEKTDLTILMRE